MTAEQLAAHNYSVVVVGAGPVGLTLANLLGRYGVRTLLVERNQTTVREPRAVSIDDESLRSLQAIGAIDDIQRQIVSGYGSEYFSPRGRRFLTVAPTQTPYGYPRRNAFRQPILEAQLRTHLATFEAVDPLFGWELVDFRQGAEGVMLDLAGPDGARRAVRSAYLVGADGASSTVRNRLGIRLEGESFAEKWLIIDLEQSPAPSRHTQVFCNTRRPCIALPGPDNTRRFEFKLVDDETPEAMLDPKNVASLLASHGAHPASILRRKTVYTFHARLAPRWSVGRVFLAGDACHLTPPFAGQGMNSGIRDAHNLAWKLAAVMKGQVGPGVLDSYELERRPHVKNMIDLALQMGRIMAPSSRLNGMLVQSVFHLLSLWTHARDYLGEMRYKPKPRFEEGFLISNDDLPARTASVGRLLPQPIVLFSDGTTKLLDNALGDGFALLAVTDDIALFARMTRPIADRLVVRLLAVSSKPCKQRSDVTVVSDPSGQLATFARGERDRVFLIRPDRYVLGSFTLNDAEHFAEKLDLLLKMALASTKDLS